MVRKSRLEPGVWEEFQRQLALLHPDALYVYTTERVATAFEGFARALGAEEPEEDVTPVSDEPLAIARRERTNTP